MTVRLMLCDVSGPRHRSNIVQGVGAAIGNGSDVMHILIVTRVTTGGVGAAQAVRLC